MILLAKKGLIGLLVTASLWLPGTHTAQAKDILIFAAASLALPLQEIIAATTPLSSTRIRISFAASSTLARQISKGAPADIFISANQRWMDYLAKRMPPIAASKRKILSNELVLISAAQNTMRRRSSLANSELTQILGDGRLAIGDPSHVPVGLYAATALRRLGLWPAVKNQLARFNNARAVLTFVERGETPAGIVYRSDAIGNDKVAVIYAFPPSSHPAITYWAARTAQGENPAAQQFFTLIAGTSAKEVFQRHGFLVK